MSHYDKDWEKLVAKGLGSMVEKASSNEVIEAGDVVEILDSNASGLSEGSHWKVHDIVEDEDYVIEDQTGRAWFFDVTNLKLISKANKEKEVVSSGFSWKQYKDDEYTQPNKYQKTTRSGAKIDVYDLLDAYKVENPAIAHAIKKMLCAGQRGYKDYEQDIEEAIQGLKRAKDFPPIPF